MDWLAAIPTLSDSALTALVATASPAALRLLEQTFAGPDCDCPIQVDYDRVCESNECEPGQCNCPLLAHVLPCPHVHDDGRFLLPPHAHALLLQRLYPADFAEPPAPPPVLDCLDPRSAVGFMAHRQRRGLGLGSLLDGWRRGRLRLSDKIERKVSRRRNGTAIAGQLYVPPERWALTDEERAEILDVENLEMLRLEAERFGRPERGAA
jgi:hypothetical protein